VTEGGILIPDVSTLQPPTRSGKVMACGKAVAPKKSCPVSVGDIVVFRPAAGVSFREKYRIIPWSMLLGRVSCSDS